jgi:hypothetical protein
MDILFLISATYSAAVRFHHWFAREVEPRFVFFEF